MKNRKYFLMVLGLNFDSEKFEWLVAKIASRIHISKDSLLICSLVAHAVETFQIGARKLN